MLLGNLLKSVGKNYRKISVNGISFDSRKVKKRDIFLQLKEIKHQASNSSMMQFQRVHQR